MCEELGFSKKHIDSIVEGEECVRIDDDDDGDGGGAVKHYKLKKQKMKMLVDLD